LYEKEKYENVQTIARSGRQIMSIPTLSTTELGLIVALAVVVVAGIAAFLLHRKRRTERLRTKFGGAEYDLAMEKGSNRRHAEAGLEIALYHPFAMHLEDARIGEAYRG
jgi:hypothetical protein